ncbi:hypothetical protein [Zooshikella ganghwensis]|uniref:hypothetical protein n=1 Tax=Zooshikella ganghwensis TaxID=202772 RepID=UPI000488BCFA|nr:hypothetical protein [Zooshikella ganghwensis]
MSCFSKILVVVASVSLQLISTRAICGNKLTITGVENMYLTKISEPILVEAYTHLGFEVEIKLAPAERALAEANSGRFDGDLNRKIGLEKNTLILLEFQ